MRRRAWALAVLSMVIPLALSGCVSETIPSSSSSGSSLNSSPAPTNPLVLVDAKSTTGQFGVRSIVGDVRNDSDRTYSYVDVEINLYDGSGSQVGSTVANVNNVAPHSTWHFSAPVLQDSATKFKVMKVDGF